MKALFCLFETELLISICCIAEKHALEEPNSFLSESNCSQIGSRLVGYTEIQSNSLDPEILSQLQNGQSAWIEGYAKFSPFLAWYGCFKKPTYRSDIFLYTLSTPNLYLCITGCLHRKANITYVGVANTSCFCFDDNQKESLRTDSVNSSFCHTPCSSVGIDLCGGNDFMSLYRIVRQIVWKKKRQSLRQCVNVERRKKDGYNRFLASTASCFTLDSPSASGYVCTNSLFSRLNTSKCKKMDSSGKFCLVEKASTRQEAFNDCLYENGTLIEYFGETYCSSLMSNGQRYWISVFRTFEPSYKSSSNALGCLAVTRMSNKLYLDPDNCTARKSYLCQELNRSPKASSGTVSRGKSIFPATSKSYINFSDADRDATIDVTTRKSPTSLFHSTKHPSKYSSATAPTDIEFLPLTSESTEINTAADKHWTVSDNNCTSDDRLLVTSSPTASSSTITMSYVQTTNDRLMTNSTDVTPYIYEEPNTTISGRSPTIYLSTVYANENKIDNDPDTNGTSLIVYILPTSFLLTFIIVVVVALVVYKRTRTHQNKAHSQTNVATSLMVRKQDTSLSFSNIYQNVGRNANQKDQYAETEIEGRKHESQDDQYDKIEFVELKAGTCEKTSQYDNVVFGAAPNRYNSMDYIPFTGSAGETSTSFTSLSRKDCGITVTDPWGQVQPDIVLHINGEQEDEEHIYHVLMDETNAYSNSTIGEHN